MINNTNRENIYRVNRHSNLEEKTVQKSLTDHVYAGKPGWNSFLKIFLLSLGTGFTVAGIVFFFAYNWEDLHKFAKLGLAETTFVIAAACIFISKFNETTRSIMLTVACVLVGVLFAVFGQIYQTGANAYDFFLGWTVFITLCVLVSDFAPLWLIYIVLVNTTVFFYAEQVADHWQERTVFLIHFFLNTAALGVTILLQKIKNELHIPLWFTNAVAFAAAFFATVGSIIEIVDYNEGDLYIVLLTVLLIYGSGVYYALNKKSIFYLAVIAFSSIIIISTVIIDAVHGSETFFFVFIFIIGSVTGVIKGLLSLHKIWSHE
jgi:uncharacterized membrane protein